MMSDVLHLGCSVENEVARSAIKSFAGSLEKVFDQYRKLWDEYLLLLAQSKGINSKPCCITPELNFWCKDKNTTFEEPIAQSVLCNEKTSDYISQDVSLHASTPGINFDLESGFLSPNENLCDKLKNENYVTSPIFSRNRQKHMRVNSSPKSTTSLCSEKDTRLSPMHTEQIIEKGDRLSNNLKTLVKVKDNTNIEFVSNSENNCNVHNVIDSKACKMLKISKIHNVDTMFLSNGKRLRQTKLITKPPQEKTEITFWQPNVDLDQLKIHTKLTSKQGVATNKQSQDLDVIIINDKNSQRNSLTSNKRYYDEVEETEEDIVEVSPKRINALSKIKRHLKLRRKSPEKDAKEYNRKTFTNSHHTPDPNTFFSKKLGTLLNKDNESAKMHISAQIPLYSCITTNLETINDAVDNKRVADSDGMNVCLSPTQADFKKHSQDMPNITEKMSTMTERNLIKYKEIEERLQASAKDSQISQDETFFTFGEKGSNKEVYEMHDSDFDEKMICNDTVNESPSFRKKLLDSFNIVPKKKEDIQMHKPTKAKDARAKLDGLACWECDQYYKNLGLSEKELQQRKNQCSRHRTRYDRQSTPEDFWNPLFPDTMCSTFRDD